MEHLSPGGIGLRVASAPAAASQNQQPEDAPPKQPEDAPPKANLAALSSAVYAAPSAAKRMSVSVIDAELAIPWHQLHLDGLEGISRPFGNVIYANKQIAEQRAILAGCSAHTLLVKNDDGGDDGQACRKPRLVKGGHETALNPALTSLNGNPLAELRTAPLCGNLHEYGVGRAVRLYLRMQLEMALLFTCLFLLSLLHVLDNTSRNAIRNDCRAALAVDYDGVLSDPSNPMYATCGYHGFHVRDNISRIPDGTSAFALVMYGPLSWAHGACMEFSNATKWLQPVPTLATDESEVFVDVPGSSVCAGARSQVGYWLELLLVCVVLATIVALRSHAVHLALRDDKARWTTGDYAVVLRGLTDGLDRNQPDRMTAHELKKRVATDLAALGFGARDIVQIEVGRRCRAEIGVLKRLESLNVNMQETLAKAAHRTETAQRLAAQQAQQEQAAAARRSEGGGGGGGAGRRASSLMLQRVSSRMSMRAGRVADTMTTTLFGPSTAVTKHLQEIAVEFSPKERKRCVKLAHEMEALLARLQELWREPDYATGHAFIVLRHETTRNEVIRKLRSMTAERPSLLSRLWRGVTRAAPAAPGSGMLPHSAAGKASVQCMPAPEPSDVLWENLELTDEFEVRTLRKGACIIVLLQCFSIFFIVSVRALKARNEQAAVSNDPTAAALFTVLFSGLASFTTAGMNAVLKQVVMLLTTLEGQDSHTEFEASLFAKLSVAYTFNSAAIPILVGSIFSWWVSGATVDQSWYEPGGVCGQAWLLMVINSVAKDSLKVVRPLVRARRSCARAYSQAKLNRLWRPPTFHIGDLYASSMKTTALGLAYGPIYPVVYLWTVFAYLFCYLCTRLSITEFYRRPPAVDESMVASFCKGMTIILTLHVLVAAFGCYAQGIGLADGLPVYVLAPLALLCYMLAPLHKCFKAFRPYDDVEMGVLDTQGVPYEDIKRVRKHELDVYVCPKLNEEVMRSSRRALVDFRRMTRIASGGDEDDDEAGKHGAKQNNCCEKLSSSIDDLMANIFE